MQRTKGLILLAIILLSSVSAWTQTDTSFWFAEPMFKYDERYIKNELRICTYDSTIISTQTYYYNTARQLVSHTQTDTLSAHQELGTGGESFDNQLNITNIGYGYHITTSRPVSTTFLSRAHYSLKGANALGTHFVVPAPLHDKIETIRSGIDIIATEDSTLVTIYPANPLLNLPAGPHSVTLQRGQTYYVRAASTNPSRQLGGSIVTSNHPIAVNTTSSDVKLQDRIYAPADLTGDQIVPTRLLGTRYLLPANPVLSYDEQLAIYSFHDSTQVYIDGITPITLDSGDYTRQNILSPGTLVTSNHPIALFITSLPGYLDGTQPPQIENTGSNRVFIGGAIARFGHMVVFVPTADTAHFQINNGPDTRITTFHPVTADSSWSWGYIHTDTLFIHKTVSNCARFHIFRDWRFPLRFSGSGTVVRNGQEFITDYLANGAQLHFDMPCHFCEGDTIRFNIVRSEIDTVVFSTPYGMSHFLYDTTSLIASNHIGGWYYIQGYDTSDCLHTDSIFITIHTPFYREIFDTIVENQLPWDANGITFTQSADTLITIPSLASNCDSTIDYHLFVYPNINDTVIYYICEGELPFVYEGDTLLEDGSRWFHYTGAHGEDSNIVIELHINNNTESTIYDTIIEAQLPWFVFDTVFNDSINDYLYHTYNEAGCDSLIHYSLYIFWDGDHCDSSLTYPNVVTPNGDGQNDRFVIGGLVENQCFKYNELSIFSREGTLVYHKRNIASESDWWDPAAHHAPAGTYFYIFKAHGINIHTMHKGVIEVLSE